MKFIDYLNNCLKDKEFRQYWEEEIADLGEELPESNESLGTYPTLNIEEALSLLTEEGSRDVTLINEVREKDGLYFAGPFWLIGNSLREINEGDFQILSEKFLVDYNGNPVAKTAPETCTHEHIWNNKYKSIYSVEYNYYPRGRIVFQRGKLYLNIPEGLNVPAIKEKLLQEFDYNRDFDNIFYKDPTTGGHYSFQLR